MTFKPIKPVDARLTLQDPLVWDQAQTPAARLSRELTVSTESEVDRANSRETWRALQLQTEDVVAMTAELQKQSQLVKGLTKEVSDTRSKAKTLEEQLVANEERRFNHPLIYSLGAVALASAGFWLLERRKRLALQDLVLLDSRHSSLASMSSDSTHVFVEPQADIFTDKAEVSSQEAASLEKVDTSFTPALPWWERLWTFKQTEKISSFTGIARTISPSIKVDPIATRSDSTVAQAALSDTSTHIETDFFDPEFAQIELFTQTRLKPSSPDDAMGHLLELRMATHALCVLEQPNMAQRLLAQHIDAVPSTCAWAYLEYLSLCTRLGHREAFESMRMRYRNQFNRLAPYWMEPNSNVQGLESYERPLAELISAWPSERAQILLKTWLLGNLHARRLFQLSAYHDLLDLYEVLEHLNENFEGVSLAIEFPPTVSLLELDYEFSDDVKLQAQSEDEAMRAVPTVKTGDFAVDINISLSPPQSQPAQLSQSSIVPFKPSPTGLLG